MNFDHINRISDYTRTEIMPNLASRMHVTDFGDYLSKMCESPSCRWMRKKLRAYPINYFVDPVAFTKKYAKKCIAFMGTMSPQDGSMNMVYQISPTLHILARLYHWIEQDKVRAYLMLTCAYRDQAEYLKFFDENKSLRLTGDTEEKSMGFNPRGQSDSVGLQNLLKGFGKQAAIVDEEPENDGLDLNR